MHPVVEAIFKETADIMDKFEITVTMHQFYDLLVYRTLERGLKSVKSPCVLLRVENMSCVLVNTSSLPGKNMCV
jgi:hypothetical protein